MTPNPAEHIGIPLPNDGRDSKQQVGRFETRGAESDIPLYLHGALTSSVLELTIPFSRRYSIKSDVDFHIETRLEGGAPTDPTQTSPLVESNERLAVWFAKDVVIKVVKNAAEADGNIWITPN